MAHVPRGRSPTPTKCGTRGDVPAPGWLTKDAKPNVPGTQSRHLLNTSGLKTPKGRRAASKRLVRRAEHVAFPVLEPQAGSGNAEGNVPTGTRQECHQEGRGTREAFSVHTHRMLSG